MTLKKFQIFRMQRSTCQIFTGVPLHRWCHEKSHFFPMGSSCHVPSFNFFSLCGFGDTEVQFFPVFQRWRQYHVTYDIIIINEIFYGKDTYYGENFVSIRLTVAEKMNLKRKNPKIWWQNNSNNYNCHFLIAGSDDGVPRRLPLIKPCFHTTREWRVTDRVTRRVQPIYYICS